MGRTIWESILLLLLLLLLLLWMLLLLGMCWMLWPAALAEAEADNAMKERSRLAVTLPAELHLESVLLFRVIMLNETVTELAIVRMQKAGA